MMSTIIPLAGEWRFSLDLANVGEASEWFKSDFNDDAWLQVHVPSNWDFYLPELMGYTGVGWFRRTFIPFQTWAEKRLLLKFEGVNYSMKVWVNGVLVGSHEGGFTPFEFDITNKVRPSESNLISVKVDNLPGEDRVPSSLAGWWNFGGIYRDIYIEVKNDPYIDNIFITAQPIGNESKINLRLSVANKSLQVKRLRIETSISTPKGELVLNGGKEPRLSFGGEVSAGGSKVFETEVLVKGLMKWSTEDPNLYVLKAMVKRPDGELVDAVSTTFGVRSVTIRYGKLHLNGEPVTIKGVNRHEEYPGAGRVDHSGILEADLKLIKEDLGANMVRIHYPCESRFYDLADKLGLLVFAEIPFWGITKEALISSKVVENARQQLTDLVRKFRNHPSVVVWSVGNEVESDTEVARSVISDLIGHVRSMDSTRPITYVTMYIYDETRWCRCLDLGDFASFNAYFDLHVDRLNKVFQKIHKENPSRPILMTEFGAEAIRGIHGNVLGSEEHQAEVIEKTWNLISSKDYVMGGLVWSLTDYWHQPRKLGTTYLNPVYFLHGILDIERRPKKAYHVLRKLFALEKIR